MKKTIKGKGFLRISDLSLCSTLCCYGYRIESIERLSTGKAFFLIERDEKLDNLVKLYFAHQLKVEPLSFFNFLKEIKTQIYNFS